MKILVGILLILAIWLLFTDFRNMEDARVIVGDLMILGWLLALLVS